MSEGNMNERVVLEVTREQAQIIERDCELLARLRLGQFEHITEACLDFGSAEYCKRRDYVNPFLDAAAKVIYGVTTYGYPNCKEDDVFHRAWSVYEVLRYTRCWHDHPEGGSWSVCFDPPLNRLPAGEPLPTCEIKGK